MNNYQTRLLERRAQFVQRWLQRVSIMRTQLMELKQNPQQPDLLQAINKGFHQLSGAAGIYELKELCDVAISCEDACLFLISKNDCPDGQTLFDLAEKLAKIETMLAELSAPSPSS